MRIICLVKFVPKVDDFKYDAKHHVLIRENVPLILNPDDACALEYALSIKDKYHQTLIEIVCMGPLNLQEKLKDLLRRKVDQAFLISDKKYIGSDSFATATILARHLKTRPFDLILCGNQTLDGDTGHIGPQIGELLDLPQCSSVIKIDHISSKEVTIQVEEGGNILTLKASLPALLSISRNSTSKLRFVKSSDLKKNVDHQLSIVTNDCLFLKSSEIGLKGSPTKVKKTWVEKMDKITAEVVECDDVGIEKVYQFLRQKGVI